MAEEHVDALGTQVVLQRQVELLRLFGAEVADGAVDELQACANGAAADDADLIGVGHALHMGVRAEFQVDLVRIVNEGLGKVRADEVREIAADLVVQRELAVRECACAGEAGRDVAGLAVHALLRLALRAGALFHALALFDHQNLLVCAAAEQLDGRKDAGRTGTNNDQIILFHRNSFVLRYCWFI